MHEYRCNKKVQAFNNPSIYAMGALLSEESRGTNKQRETKNKEMKKNSKVCPIQRLEQLLCATSFPHLLSQPDHVQHLHRPQHGNH